MLHITVGQLLEQKALAHPAHEAVVYADRQLRWSYRQFNDYCRLVAKGLMKLGIEAGEHIAVWATNKPEWLACQFATGKMGAVLVTVNTNYRTAELEYLLKQSDATTIILMEQYRDTSYIDIIYEIAPELAYCEPGKLQVKRLPQLRNVIVLSEQRYPGTFSWNDLLAMAEDVEDAALDVRMNSLDPHDVINMQYTSGTTGFPKGVMLTHYNIVNNAYYIAECMKLTKEDRLCIPVPFFIALVACSVRLLA